MGLLSDISAVKKVQNIKKGNKEKLSISQITGLITNMMDANKNLNEKEYNQVYKLYEKLRKCNTKMEMDLNGYYETCVDIIKQFDSIAPYEKYSGGNEVEFSFLMGNIRKQKEPIEELKNNPLFGTQFYVADEKDYDKRFDDFTEEDEKYIKELRTKSNNQVTDQIARDFIRVIRCYSFMDKYDAFSVFNTIAEKIFKSFQPGYAIFTVSFLVENIHNLGLIGEDEVEEIKGLYQEKLKEMLLNR